jgi:tRNA 5-methylaminomethyl-2-thiouridine biosynthesis bifunctional protein
MRLPPRPDLTWKEDGTPVDERVGDIYFSVEDGLSESRAVFLAGCGLPDAWQERAAYTIAELGFGTGLNFLATWHMWRKHRSQNAWLNYVSFEGYPLDREDAERALNAVARRARPGAKALRAMACPREGRPPDHLAGRPDLPHAAYWNDR